MRNFNFKYLTSVLLLVGFLSFSSLANATTLTSYDFNTVGDLGTHFNADGGASFLESASGGLSDSRSVDVDTLSGIYTSKSGYAPLSADESYSVGAYFLNNGTSGYGGLGFLVDSSAEQSNGIPATSHGVGVYFHGGGGGFVNNGVDVDSLTWPGGDLVDGNWYKMIFSYTNKGSNSYDLEFQIWSSDADGNLVSKYSEHTFSVTNSYLAGAVAIHPYFDASGSDRFVKVDNFEVGDAPLITPFSGAGAGTVGDPYIITTCSEFTEINNRLGSDIYYSLGNDIDCSSIGNDVIIGDNSSTFQAHFNGNDHEITVDIDTTSSPLAQTGLFAIVNSGGSIQNTKVAGSVSGDAYTGSLVGYMDSGEVTDSSSSAQVTGSDGSSGAGGLIGLMNNSSVSGSFSTGLIRGTDLVGGLIGGAYCNSFIEDSFASGSVIGAMSVGGLVGENGCEGIGATYNNVYADGSVNATGDYAGGLVGQSTYGVFSQSYATGNVTSLGRHTGGLAGYAQGGSSFSQVYSTGDVSGVLDVGGLFGGLDSSEVLDAYSTGDLTGSNEIGGIVGYMFTATLTNVYYAGTILSEVSSMGSLLGFDDGSNVFYASFWDLKSGANPVSAGADIAGDPFSYGKDTETMKDVNTYTTYIGGSSWNFEGIWQINTNTNDGYPSFVWQQMAPLLVEHITIPEKVKAKDAKYYFSVEGDTTGYEYLFEDCGAETIVDPINHIVSFGNLKAGHTYGNCSFEMNSDTGPSSNQLYIGLFRVIDSGSTGGSRPDLGPVFSTEDKNQNTENGVLDGRAKTSLGGGSCFIVSVLKKGNNNQEVKCLQQILNKKGFVVSVSGLGSVGNESTYFGEKTKNAVMKFQTANNLKADGVVGPLTWSKLK